MTDSVAMIHSQSRFDRRASALALTAIAFIFSSLRPASSDDWPRYRGPSHNGISADTSWSHRWSETGPTVAWSAQVGTGFSSCSISDQRLFTIGNQQNIDIVFCFDSSSGTLLWTHSYDSPGDPNEFEGGPTSTPTVDGQVVFTLARGGDLFALDAATGNVKWHKTLAAENQIPIPTWGFTGSPLVDGERLLLNIGDAGAAVNKISGDLVWKSENRECGYSSPIPIEIQSPKKVVFGSGRSYVCIDPETGKRQWRHSLCECDTSTIFHIAKGNLCIQNES